MKKIRSLRAKADAAIAERSKRVIPEFFILNFQYWMMIYFELIIIRENGKPFILGFQASV